MEKIPDCGFKFHDHTADITVQAWAPSLEDAFSQCALATFEVILDTATISPEESLNVSVSGVDLKELLVEWIGYLLSLIDINYQFYSRFDVDSIEKTDNDYTLTATIWGEDISHEKHDTRTEVKAITYADMKIERTTDKITIWFTLDL